VDAGTDSPDGSASTSFCTGQEPSQPLAQPYEQQQPSSCAAAAPVIPPHSQLSADAFVDGLFGPDELPGEQRGMLKELLSESISSNSYRSIISQQMRKLPPERVRRFPQSTASYCKQLLCVHKS
jgi:hypothetical protein